MTNTFTDLSGYPGFVRPYGPMPEAWYICDNPKHEPCFFYVRSEEQAIKGHRRDGVWTRGCRVRLYRKQDEERAAAGGSE
jgi:hypothetical protein